jgi:hypothetical protein
MWSMHEKFAEFIALKRAEKAKAFSETSQAMKTTAQAIEKDFWVCLVLDVLFSLSGNSRPRLLFKGGTSLSKAYNLIRRFSEDIDFVVFRQDLGFLGDKDPTGIEGTNKRNALWEEVKQSAKSYIVGPLQEELADVLRGIAPTCHVLLDEKDPDGSTILVTYETLFPGGAGYIAPHVKLEGGARSALDPHTPCDVSPYIVGYLKTPEWKVVGIPTISPQRTFLDKVMLAHGWYHGSMDGRNPSDKQRLSRHYYDLAMVFESEYGNPALVDLELLASVREHALSAFKRGWMKLDQAVPGTIRIVPKGTLRDSLKQDYGKMQGMMFGSPPTFEFIMERLATIEQILNDVQLKASAS